MVSGQVSWRAVAVQMEKVQVIWEDGHLFLTIHSASSAPCCAKSTLPMFSRHSASLASQ